jgi:hypothetical protein
MARGVMLKTKRPRAWKVPVVFKDRNIDSLNRHNPRKNASSSAGNSGAQLFD